jgi:hypothetical protein
MSINPHTGPEQMDQQSGLTPARRTRKSEPFLLAGTLALSVLLPVGAHHHLARRIDADLAPALTALANQPVRIGGVDADLTGAVRLRDVAVGKLLAADAIEAAVIPSLEALAGGALRIREIRVERPRLHVRVDRLGRTDVEDLLGRVRAHLDARASGLTANRSTPAAAAGPHALPRIVVTRGALGVSLGDCGHAELRGIELLPRRGGVRAVVSDADLALDCASWRVQGTLGRAAADIGLPGLGLERLLAVGGQLDVAALDAGRPGTPPVTLVDLRLASGIDAPGLILQGRVSRAGADGTFAIEVDRSLGRSLGRDAPGLRAQFRGSDMPLAPFAPLVPRSVDLSQGRGSGHLTVLAGEELRVDVDAALDRVLVDDRRVAHVPLELSGRIEAALGTQARDGAMHVVLERARFHTGALAIEARGDVRYDRPSYWLPDRADIELTMPRVACAQALASLPEGLRDHLTGMELDGDVQAAARLRFDRALIDDTSLELDVDVSGCTVRREAEAADPRRLLAPFEHYVASGTRRQVGAGLPGYVSLPRLPRYLPLAFVAGEDARFFEHDGFDVYQIERSLAVDLRDRAFVRGGSTISQQTVKNLFLSHRRTLARKLQEAVLTWRLEAHLGKEQILERYLNVIELGPGVFGIDEAARYWFGKDPSALGVHEAAFLAALTPAPQTLSRRILEAGGIDDDMRHRIDVILANMRRERIITEADHDRARRARLVLAPDATRG